MTTTQASHVRHSRGSVHRWSRTLIPTTKEAPADAEAPSHKLLVRAGFIRRVGAGIYDYLPLAWRTLQKISHIVREEMDATGAAEMLMPALEPIELYADTKRDIDYGDNLFKLTDRHGREVALAPTHEEVITELLKGAVNSYRQLPLGLYQIQTKFRDEARPRSGLLRCREFIMKDAYTFHMAVEGPGGLNEAYDAMHRAYVNVFTRCGLDFTVVEAESGPIGGSASHEFMVNCATGEDTILKCPVSGYAANVEKCEIGERGHDFNGAPSGELAKVHTPGMQTIEEVGKFMKVKPERMLKVVLYARKENMDQRRASDRAWERLEQESGSEAPEQHYKKQLSEGKPTGRSRSPGRPEWIVAVVRGDHEVNEGKLKDAVGFGIEIADTQRAKGDGFAIGFMSPRSVIEKSAMLVVDPDAAQGGFWAAGADEPDHHVKHFNWRREMGDVLDAPSYVKVADIRNARAGDPSPRAQGAALEEARGIEVGHIFKLGDKYSRAMGFEVLDADQQRKPVIMGCYGIGVSRTMAACVEMSSDADGIVWPAAIAPYHVHIVPMGVDAGSPLMQTALDLAAQLGAAGLDVLVDDRDERPGVKFKDADLLGMPIRLTIGEKALAEGCAEFKLRSEKGKGEMVKLDEVVGRCLGVVGGG